MPDESSPLPTSADVAGLRRLARGLLGREDLAEDAVQDAWIVARERGGPPGTAWLGGIVRYRAMQLLRREGRRKRHEGRAPPGRESPEPLEHVQAIEQQRIVLEELQRLPEPYRLTLWLRFFAGRSNEAAAAEQGVPAATVRTRVHRGLRMLGERMDERHEGRRDWWAPALLPFAFPPSPRTSAAEAARAATTGGVSTGAWVVAGLAALAVPAAWMVVSNTGGSEPTAPLSSHEGGRVAGPTLAGAGRRVQPDRATSEREIRLRPRVLLASGETAAGATVYALPKDRVSGDAAYPAVSALVPSDGVVELALRAPESHWILVAPARESDAARLVVDGAHLESGESPEWRLSPARRVHVSVSGPEPEVLAAARVDVLPEHSHLAVPWPGPEEPFLGLDVSRPLGAGRFEVSLADGGVRWLRVAAPGCAPVHRRLAGDVRIHVALEPSATIRVHVESPAGELPPDLAATLEAVGPGPKVAAARGRLDGRDLVFSDGVARGRHRLRVTAARHFPVVEEVLASGGGAIDDLRVRLESCGAEGSLVLVGAPSRAPGPTEITDRRGTVLVRRAGRLAARWEVLQATVQPDGSLVLAGLPPAPIDLVVIDGRGPRVALVARADVIAGARRNVSLEASGAAFWLMPPVESPGDIVGATVRLPDGTAWPLYRWDSAGTSMHEGADLPRAGARVGPYPVQSSPPVLVLDRRGREEHVVFAPWPYPSDKGTR